jgi:hypothetical protein
MKNIISSQTPQTNIGTWLLNKMKRKREVLMSIEGQYDDFMMTWAVQDEYGILNHVLIPFTSSAKEEHYLIANAANKFWELMDD